VLFSQLTGVIIVVCHKANDGVVYAIRAFLSSMLHCLQWYKNCIYIVKEIDAGVHDVVG